MAIQTENGEFRGTCANTKVTSHVGEDRKDFKSKCNGGQHWADHSLGQTGQWSPERPLVTDIRMSTTTRLAFSRTTLVGFSSDKGTLVWTGGGGASMGGSAVAMETEQNST